MTLVKIKVIRFFPCCRVAFWVRAWSYSDDLAIGLVQPLMQGLGICPQRTDRLSFYQCGLGAFTGSPFL